MKTELEVLHQDPRAVYGEYNYQCGWLDCLKAAKQIVMDSYVHKSITQPTDDARVKAFDALVELVNKAYQNHKLVGEQEEILELENTIRSVLTQKGK
jgi:hypothetical protein